MSNWEKLLSKILSLDNSIRFEELKKVLEHYGYEMRQPRRGSSHYTFRKRGNNPITIPKNKSIKKAYVKMVKEIVKESEKNEKN